MIRKHSLETAIIMSFIFWILASCGTRQVETEKKETKTGNISVVNSSIQSVKTIFGTSFNYTPFDGSKPMIIEGKTYNNAVISGGTKKEMSRTSVWYKKYNINTTVIIEKTKKTERTDNTILFFGLFLILVTAIWSWFYFKK